MFSLSCTENAMLEVEVNREVLRLVLATILTLVHNNLRGKRFLALSYGGGLKPSVYNEMTTCSGHISKLCRSS